MLALFELGDAVIVETGWTAPYGDIAVPDRDFARGIATL
jgi:hypothetical protein